MPPNPLICQGRAGKTLWKLPEPIPCPVDFTFAGEDRPVSARVQLYKRNHILLRSDAWLCTKYYQKTSTFTYFFNDEHLRKDEQKQLAIDSQECHQMITWKKCNHGAMTLQGHLWKTVNKHKFEWSGGGVHCCKWQDFETTNCFLSRTSVYKRFDTPEMESPAGNVRHCSYKKGLCSLENGGLLSWKIEPRANCRYLSWREIQGKKFGDHWISDDGQLALTFIKPDFDKDCQGNHLTISDQGVPMRYTFLGHPPPPRVPVSQLPKHTPLLDQPTLLKLKEELELTIQLQKEL